MLHDGWGITGDKIFAIAQSQHHAAGIADARGHDLVRFIGRHEHDYICALNLLERLARGFHQADAGRKIMFHQVNNGFGVGL